MVKRVVRDTLAEDPVAPEAERLGAGHEIRQLALADIELEPGSAPRAAALASSAIRLYGEWAGIMLGMSGREVPSKDSRFADPAWRDNPLYRRLGQGYLAFCDAADTLAGDNKDWRKRERAKFLTGILTSSLAPTNTSSATPAALKRVFETGGMSMLAGAKNMVGDLLHNKGMPSQVNKAAFKVGKNLAATPGAVVFRNEMVELIQYQPTTSEVCERPTLMIVPPIGKYYFMDLAAEAQLRRVRRLAGRADVCHQLAQSRTRTRGLGPRRVCADLPRSRRCGLRDRGKRQAQPVGMCAGGIISTLMLCVMAKRRRQTCQRRDVRRHAAGLRERSPARGVPRQAGAGTGRSKVRVQRHPARCRPRQRVRVDAAERPGVELLGEQLPDGQRSAVIRHPRLERRRDQSAGQASQAVSWDLSAQPDLDAGSTDCSGRSRSICSTVRIDALITGALTDHLTPWKACYRSTQLLGRHQQLRP